MTAAISKKDLDMQIKILKADRNRQIPVAVKALEGLRRAEEKYHFEFQSIGIDEEFEKLRKDTPTESIVEQFVGLEYSVHTPETVDRMLAHGFTTDEIEEFLYYGEA